MFNSNQRNLVQRSTVTTDNRPSITIPVKLEPTDTYITNKQSDLTSKIYDPVAKGFVTITDLDIDQSIIDSSASTEYLGGIGNNLLYRERSYTKVGTVSDEEVFKSIFVFSPKALIESAIRTTTGASADNTYKFGKASISISATETQSTAHDLYVSLLPLGLSVDDSASWEKPSEAYSATWTTEGGDIDPTAQGITIKGMWDSTENPEKITFDITDYMSIWKTSETHLVSLVINDDGSPKDVIKFFSAESTDVKIGGSALTNCRFYTGVETQTTSIAGVRVMITPTGTTASISFVDPSCEAEKRWVTFNGAATVGGTCSIVSPDFEQGILIGSVICTITDKTAGPRGPVLVVSGLSLGSVTNYYTTAEFSTTKNINSGFGYVELTNPDEKTLSDISLLKENDIIKVEYSATLSENNVRQYTVKYTADEKFTNNRARIYFNEQVVSENRNGQLTELLIPTKRPSVDLQIIV
jgi:hypothetical protein